MSTEKRAPTYKIEQPQESDAVELTRMHGQSWLDTYPNSDHGVSLEFIKNVVASRATPEGIAKRRTYIRESYENLDYFLRIARNNEDEIVGFVDGRIFDDHQELAGLYIDRSVYGTGVAKQLSDAFFEWADKAKPTQVEVVSYNDRAQAFYRKIGFVPVPDSESLFRDIIPTIKMKRPPEESA